VAGLLDVPTVRALLNPFEATQRAYEPFAPGVFSVVYALIMLSGVPLAWAFSPKKKPDALIYYGAFWLTLGGILLAEQAVFVHHTILAFPFLIMAALTARVSRRALCAFAILNVVPFLMFWRQPVLDHDDSSKVALNAVLRDSTLARRYLYVVVDWGLYYYQGLYGHDQQAVVYMEPLNLPYDIARLDGLRRSSGRKVAILYRRNGSVSDVPLLTGRFGLWPCAAVERNAVWQVLLERGENRCFPVGHDADAQRTPVSLQR
jgi:hypothetical protein